MSPRRRKAEDVDVFEVTLGGSFLAWTLYREGFAAEWLREDLEATLRPYLVRRKNGVRQR